MAAIRSLLNPAPEMSGTSESETERPPKDKHYSSINDQSPSHQLRKKQKICKDAAIFLRGPIRGECRYPPYEYQDDMIAAQHQQFEVYPMGEIADYPRHIPYNSEKKFFFEKTGRESLEVFQYQFKVPGDDIQYTMLWDYNIGLVRTTPLFKCTGHSKTTPAKMLNRNPGLRDVCHSITGGALVAQGYWMPYDAAKAVAATFCWTIRYALTPVFGIDFPSMCVHPDSDNFGDMVIDSGVIKRCTEQAKMYRNMEHQTFSRAPSHASTPPTPDTPTHPRQAKNVRPKMLEPFETPYAFETGSECCHTLSPMTPERAYRGLWTPANTPRSVPLLSAPGIVRSRKRPAKSNSSSGFSSPQKSPKSRYVTETDEGYDGDSSEGSGVENIAEATRRVSISLPSDEKAAYLLMSLRLQNGDQQDCRGKKRRAST